MAKLERPHFLKVQSGKITVCYLHLCGYRIYRNGNDEEKCLCQMLAGNGIVLQKLFWPTVRKNCSSDQDFFLKFQAEGLTCKFFEITRTIYSNSERSEQFLVTECFFTFFLEVSYIQWIRTIIIQIGKKQETCGKS